jgi:hypothetical protein
MKNYEVVTQDTVRRRRTYRVTAKAAQDARDTLSQRLSAAEVVIHVVNHPTRPNRAA